MGAGQWGVVALGCSMAQHVVCTMSTAQPCWLATAMRAATVFSVWCRFMYTLEPTPSVLQAGSHD